MNEKKIMHSKIAFAILDRHLTFTIFNLLWIDHYVVNGTKSLKMYDI